MAPSSAPADGADKGTSACDECSGGASASVGKDPYVGSFPTPAFPSGDNAYATTGGDGDKTGNGKGSQGPSEED